MALDNKVSTETLTKTSTKTKVITATMIIAVLGGITALSISANKSNRGWHIRAEISENTREIFYKLPNMKKFKSLGHLQYKNPRK